MATLLFTKDLIASFKRIIKHRFYPDFIKHHLFSPSYCWSRKIIIIFIVLIFTNILQCYIALYYSYIETKRWLKSLLSIVSPFLNLLVLITKIHVFRLLHTTASQTLATVDFTRLTYLKFNKITNAIFVGDVCQSITETLDVSI